MCHPLLWKSAHRQSVCHDDISFPDFEYIIHQNSHIFKLFSHLNVSDTLSMKNDKFHMTHATFGRLWILRLQGWKYRINHSDHFKMSKSHLWSLAHNKCKKSEPMRVVVRWPLRSKKKKKFVEHWVFTLIHVGWARDKLSPALWTTETGFPQNDLIPCVVIALLRWLKEYDFFCNTFLLCYHCSVFVRLIMLNR